MRDIKRLLGILLLVFLSPNLFYGQTKPFTSEVSDDPAIVVLLNLAFIQEKYSENYDGAIAIYSKVIDKIKAEKGVDHPDYAHTLILYSQSLLNKGDYKGALENSTTAYNFLKDELNGDMQTHTMLVNNLGYNYHINGDYETALTYYLELIKLHESAQNVDKTEYCGAYNNLAGLYDDIGQIPKAIESYEKALSICKTTKEESSSIVYIIHNLAFMYNKIENYEKSFELINQSLVHGKNHFGVNSSNYANSLGILAMNYQDTGEYEKALSNFNKGLAIIEEVYGKEHLSYASSLINIGRLKEETNELDEAITFFNEALEIVESTIGKQNLKYRGVLLDIALAYQAQGDFKKAYALLKENNSITLNQIKNNFAYQTAKEKQSFITESIGDEGLNHLANYNYLSQNDNAEAATLALNNILTSKGLILSATKDLLSDLKSLNNKSLNDSITRFIKNRAHINKQLQLPVKERDAKLDAIIESNGNLERVLVNASKKHFKNQGNYVKNFKETNLSKKDLAIEFTHFSVYNKQWTDSIMYAAYLYKKGWKAPKVVHLFEEKELQEYFEKYSSRGAVATSNKKNQKVAISELLYEMIWKPLEPHLKNVETIYYSPDGLLHKVPINALPTSEGRFLGEIYNLNRVSNTATINTEDEFPDLTNLLLIGDVTYDYKQTDNTIKNEGAKNSILKSEGLLGNEKNKNRNASKGSWAYLPGTKEEIELIQNQLPKSRVLREKEASEVAFKNLSGESPSVLHISTHGYFFPDVEEDKSSNTGGNYSLIKDPLLRSGLILANANYAWQNGSNPYEKEDGILTALEISTLDLRDTDIVILSACDTGLGDIPSSEGVYGLQRAFKMAGVNTIIMTLWEVPDKETAEFMGKFYTKWKTTNNPKESFKHAQNFMMKKYRYQPDKWAAFVYFE